MEGEVIMKKKIWSTGLLLSMLGTAGMNVMAAPEEKSVDVMFLHDTHSHLNEFATVEEGEGGL